MPFAPSITRRLSLVCVLLAAAAPASAASPTLLYSKNGQNTPNSTTWSGSAWSSSVAIPSVGGQPAWVVAKSCPVRDETMLATLDNGNDVNVCFATAGTWGSVTELTGSANRADSRVMDAAYEQLSGDALIVYQAGNSSYLSSTVCQNGSVGTTSTIAFSSSHQVRWIKLTPLPGSDTIVLMVLSEEPKMCVAFWNGSSWSSVTTLSTSIPMASAQSFDAAPTGSGGTALIAYAKSSGSQPYYRLYNGSSLGSEQTMTSVGATPYWIKLVPDTATGRIFAAVQDANRRVHVQLWNGSSWGTSTQVGSDTGYNDRRLVDLAFTPDAAKAVVMYGTSSFTPKYRSWNGSSWSAETSASTLGERVMVVQLARGSTGNEVYAVCSDQNRGLYAMVWNGSAFSSATTITTQLGANGQQEQFMTVAAQTAAATKPTIVQWRHADPME